jgi:hypothetical protein
MHARRDSWATFLRLSHAKAKCEFLTLSNWDQPAKRDNPDRKHWSSRIAGGWAWVKEPHPVKQSLLRNSKKTWGRPKPSPGCSAEEEEEEDLTLTPLLRPLFSKWPSSRGFLRQNSACICSPHPIWVLRPLYSINIIRRSYRSRNFHHSPLQVSLGANIFLENLVFKW